MKTSSPFNIVRDKIISTAYAVKQWLTTSSYDWQYEAAVNSTVAIECDSEDGLDIVMLCYRLKDAWLVIDENFSLEKFSDEEFSDFLAKKNYHTIRNRQKKYWGRDSEKLDGLIPDLEKSAHWQEWQAELVKKFPNEVFLDDEKNALARLYLQNYYFYGIDPRKDQFDDNAWAKKTWVKLGMLFLAGSGAYQIASKKIEFNTQSLAILPSMNVISLSPGLVVPALVALTDVHPIIALAAATISFSQQASAEFSIGLLVQETYLAKLHSHCFSANASDPLAIVNAFEQAELSCEHLHKSNTTSVSCHGLYDALRATNITEADAVLTLLYQTSHDELICEEVLGDNVITAGPYAEKLTKNTMATLEQKIITVSKPLEETIAKLQQDMKSLNNSQQIDIVDLRTKVFGHADQLNIISQQVKGVLQEAALMMVNNKNATELLQSQVRGLQAIMQELMVKIPDNQNSANDNDMISQVKAMAGIALGLAIAAMLCCLYFAYRCGRLKVELENKAQERMSRDPLKGKSLHRTSPQRPVGFPHFIVAPSSPDTDSFTPSDGTGTPPLENPLLASSSRTSSNETSSSLQNVTSRRIEFTDKLVPTLPAVRTSSGKVRTGLFFAELLERKKEFGEFKVRWDNIYRSKRCLWLGEENIAQLDKMIKETLAADNIENFNHSCNAVFDSFYLLLESKVRSWSINNSDFIHNKQVVLTEIDNNKNVNKDMNKWIAIAELAHNLYEAYSGLTRLEVSRLLPKFH